LTPLLRARRGRKRQRGAAFVEAIIVICSFVLFMIGLIFFFNLYTRKIQVMRAARAATLAYAMGGCEGNAPGQWGAGDLPKGSSAPAPGKSDENLSTTPKGVAGGNEGADKAKSIVNSLPGTGTDDSILNPVGKVGLGMTVTTQSKPNPLASGLGFTKSIASNSYATCNDKVRNGDFGEIVDYVTKLF